MISNWLTTSNTATNFEVYIYPLIASLLAALIFWFLFDRIPTWRKKKSFVPILVNEMLSLDEIIIQQLDYIFRDNKFEFSPFDAELVSDSLTDEEIEYSLYTKVVDFKKIMDQRDVVSYIEIGKELAINAKLAENNIHRILLLVQFMDAKTVHLLDEIRFEITKYVNYIEKEKDSYVYDNPTTYFMKDSFINLQKLLSQLRDIIFSEKSTDSDFLTRKILRGIYKKEFTKTIPAINEFIKTHEGQPSANWGYFALSNCYHNLNKPKNAEKYWNKATNNAVDIRDVPRACLSQVISEPFTTVLKNKFGEDVVTKAIAAHERKNRLKSAFLQGGMNKKLKM